MLSKSWRNWFTNIREILKTVQCPIGSERHSPDVWKVMECSQRKSPCGAWLTGFSAIKDTSTFLSQTPSHTGYYAWEVGQPGHFKFPFQPRFSFTREVHGSNCYIAWGKIKIPRCEMPECKSKGATSRRFPPPGQRGWWWYSVHRVVIRVRFHNDQQWLQQSECWIQARRSSFSVPSTTLGRVLWPTAQGVLGSRPTCW